MPNRARTVEERVIDAMHRYAYSLMAEYARPDDGLFGISGSEAMNEVERGRVARARKLARMDPLGFRYRLPEWLDTRLRGVLRRRRGVPGAVVSDEIAFEQMRHSSEDIDSSLDLLAVGHF